MITGKRPALGIIVWPRSAPLPDGDFQQRRTSRIWRNVDQICVTELPATIELPPGKVIIHCQNMEHLLQQLVQLAKTLDNDYETLQRLIEPPPARRPVGSEMALAPVNSARRYRMKSIRNSISNACWALSQLPSC